MVALDVIQWLLLKITLAEGNKERRKEGRKEGTFNKI
jgi:hypothetical protein